MSVFTKRTRPYGLVGALGLLLNFVPPALAQLPSNDGFQRRHGQMQVLRNGQARPMTRDAHLPTGATVTKDGFVVGPDGKRTELREGQGCDLRGRPVAVLTASNGTLALASPAAVRAERVLPVRSVLEEIFGPRDRDEDNEDREYYKEKKHKKNHGKGRGRGRWKGEDD